MRHTASRIILSALTFSRSPGLRDVQVMQSHIVYDLDVATELHGRALVGLPPNSLLL